MTITIYHNANCGTSRNVLAMLRAAGHEPVIVEYLTSPPTRDELKSLIARMGIPARALVRDKEPLFEALELAGAGDDALLDAMSAHPLLINRPIVVTGHAARLCRPSETVKLLLKTEGSPP